MQTKHFLAYLGIGVLVYLLIGLDHALGAHQVPIPDSWDWAVQIILLPLGFIVTVLSALLPGLKQSAPVAASTLSTFEPPITTNAPSIPATPTATGPVGLPNQAIPASTGSTTVPPPETIATTSPVASTAVTG